MKQFLFSLLTICTLVGSNVFASNDYFPEVNALLQETNYQQIMNQKMHEAFESGQTLHITGIDVLEIFPAMFVSVMLGTRFSAELMMGELTPAGSIVGSVVYDSEGKISFDGIYFKPEADLPGGASVGNR